MSDADQLFRVCNLIALAGWALLVFAPHRRAPQLVAAGVIPVLLSAVYLVLILSRLPGADGGFESLPAVARLFQDPALLLAGWVHFLAFDLFIGAWETRDARRVGLPHLLVVPCLVLTFLLGPIGLLLYLALRGWRARTLDLAAV